MMSPEDRRRTAYHEGGHAIVGMLTDGADPVRKISIIPRGLVARRHVLGARRRPLQLRAARAAREDQGRARRACRRGDRLRRADDRCRVGHPAADRDRPPDGRPLGHERRRRPARGPARRRSRAVPPGRLRGLAATRSSWSTTRSGASSRRRTRRSSTLLRENRGKLDSLAQALLEHETLDEDDAYAAAGVPHESAETRGDARLAAERAVREPGSTT